VGAWQRPVVVAVVVAAAAAAAAAAVVAAAAAAEAVPAIAPREMTTEQVPTAKVSVFGLAPGCGVALRAAASSAFLVR
jgi:hypothetical protein